MEKENKKVFIVNKGGHDFSPAYKYGELIYMSEGTINPFETSNMFRKFETILKDSKPDDYILPTGLTNMSIIATSIFTYMHGCLNLLLYRSDKYVIRRINFTSIIDLQKILANQQSLEQDKKG